MKVALVLSKFDPRRGGLEQWTAQFAAQLAPRGHEVHVVAGSFSEAVRQLPVVAHELPRTRSLLRFAEAARAKLRRLNADVIHDMGCGWYCDVLHPHVGCWALLRQQKLQMLPRWVRPLKRGTDRWLPRQRESRALRARQLADQGQYVVAVSQRVAESLRRLGGVPAQQIRLVYNGVDIERFHPQHRAQHRGPLRSQLGIDDETVLALIVAHNFRLKGVPTLLRALAQLVRARRPMHVAVVGGRRLRPWQRMARRLGVAEHVSFVGAVDDTVPYYAAADLYVHPAYYDACSLVVLEAAASGLPVITSRINGAAEFLTEGVDGYVLSDPADAGELATRLKTLFDPEHRRRLGTAARRMARKHPFTRNVDELLALYGEVAPRRRHAA